MTFDHVTIVGPGRMGLAIGAALEQAGQVADLTYFGRHPEPPSHPLFIDGRARYVFGVEPLAPQTELLLLAVPDAVVPEMAYTIAAHGHAPQGCTAFHLSAVLPTEVLAPLFEQGYAIGSLHPLVTVSDRRHGSDRLMGSYFAMTGGTQTMNTARRLAMALGAEAFSVPAGRRPLYHAAITMGASYLLPLLGLSARLMERAGVSSEDALPALLSLVRDTATSIEAGGLGRALPDPIANGDIETVAMHLRALDPPEQHLYAVLGHEMLRIAGEGLDTATRSALADLFARYEAETASSGYGT